MKATTKKTALIVKKPELGIAKLQPPPRKADIINAMLARAREKFTTEQALRNAEREEIEKDIHALAFVEMRKQKGLKPSSIYIDKWDCCVDFKYEIKSPEIKAMIAKHQQLGDKRTFDERATREAIRRSLDTTHERVAAILSNPDAAKQIDRMLADISE